MIGWHIFWETVYCY